ncbi:MAG: MFS transporter [Peptococcaceae bacterium]|nr:MFS transporter [Peptococcaceae bacterium]
MSEVMKDKRVWFIIIALLALRFTYSMCIAHAIFHLFDKGIPQAVLATAVGTMTLFSVFGRLGAGALGDRIEPRIVWIGGMLVFIVGFLSLMFAQSAWMAILFSICVGMGFGSFLCVFSCDDRKLLWRKYFSSCNGSCFSLPDGGRRYCPLLGRFNL